MKTSTFKCDESTIDWFDKHKKHNRSELIREFLKDFIKKNGG